MSIAAPIRGITDADQQPLPVDQVTLGRTRESLLSISKAVETAFVGAGKQSMQTARLLRQLQGQLDSIGGDGGDGGKALETLVGDLAERAGALTRLGASGASADSISRISTHVSAALEQLSDLQRAYATFPVLRILTLIHGSAVPQAAQDLSWFADAIRSQAERGRKAVAHLRQAMEREAESLRDAVRTCSSADARLEQGLRHSQQVVTAAVSEMTRLTQSSTAAVQSMAHRQRELSESTSELVAAMQFQDAFRQRIEHVDLALSQLARLESEQVLMDFEGERRLDSAEAFAAGYTLTQIIGRQLLGLAEDLPTELNRLTGSVEDLQQQAVSLSSELEQALLHPEQTQAQDALVGQLQTYHDQLHQFEEAGAQRQAIAVSVASSLSVMEADLMALEEVGHAIFLLAVNAVVLSARLGTHGSAIGSIAQQIRANSTAASDAIKEIRQSYARLCEESNRQLGEVDDVANATVPEHEAGGEESDETVLGRVVEQVVELLGLRAEESQKLVNTCSDAASGFSTTQEKLRPVGAQAMRLREICSDWQRSADAEVPNGFAIDESVVSTLAAYFDAHYTMESERETQREALGELVPSVALRSPAGEAAAADATDTDGADDDDLSDILF